LLLKLLQALAFQVGSEVSYNEIGQLIGADHVTIERYIELLEKSFVIFRVNSLSRNLRNEIKKKKKIYFYDNGILNSVIKNFNPLSIRNDIGALWENFLISERVKKNHYQNRYINFYFWRTHAQQEIDYIEEYGGKFFAYEFKWNKNKRVKAPEIFMKKYNYPDFKVITPENYVDFIGE